MHQAPLRGMALFDLVITAGLVASVSALGAYGAAQANRNQNQVSKLNVLHALVKEAQLLSTERRTHFVVVKNAADQTLDLHAVTAPNETCAAATLGAKLKASTYDGFSVSMPDGRVCFDDGLSRSGAYTIDAAAPEVTGAVAVLETGEVLLVRDGVAAAQSSSGAAGAQTKGFSDFSNSGL